MSPALTTYLITGASKGIGLEMTRQLIQLPNVRIYATARNTSALDSFISELPESKKAAVVPLKLDIEEEATMKSAAAQIESSGGAIDYLLNNAAYSSDRGKVEDFDPEVAMKYFRINTVGATLVMKHFLPLVRKSTHKTIINISSGVGAFEAGSPKPPGTVYYSSSKTALNMITAYAVKEWTDVTIALITPGLTKTALSGGMGLDVDESVRRVLKRVHEVKKEDSGSFWNAQEGRIQGF